MDYQPPPFFSRGPAPLVRLMFFVSLAVLLMVLDARFRYAESVRQVAALVAYPLQRIALAPVDLFNATAEYFTSLVSLKQENDKLKTRQLETANDLLTLESLRAENEQLRRLLDAQQQLPRKSTFAEVLYAGRDPFSRKVVIDKGATQGIEAGQAVIDDIGVVGQVTRVYPLLAEVTLVTDRQLSVPVEVVRNGLRAVVFGGTEGGSMELRFMPINSDVQTGDVLVTSGIDGTYPPGLAVAQVATLERDTGQMFARITARPLAGADRSRHLLVLGPVATLPPRPDEPAEAETAKRGGRSKSRRGG